jgi:hypothetical protein
MCFSTSINAPTNGRSLVSYGPSTMEQHQVIRALYFIMCLAITACGDNHSSFAPPDHAIYGQLLKKHVSPNGDVDYVGLTSDSAVLNQYLLSLRTTPPDPKRWTRNEQVAYWINAYNAFTLQLIIEHYPVESILKIGSGVSLSFFNSPWDKRFIQIGKQRLDLNNIEHGILRKKFNDARVHMALVCASKSCPPLRNEAYRADVLDAQLDDQSRRFLNDPTRNNIATDRLAISMIFKWYQADFIRDGSSVMAFIRKYSNTQIAPDATIEYLPYNWQLNER